MTALEARIGGEMVPINDAIEVAWVDRAQGIARVRTGERSMLAVVDGDGTAWWVTLRGRRIGVEVQSWRERVLAEAEGQERTAGGPVTVTANLPGLIVAVRVAVGDQIEAGDPLLTIEAMKMQNEVRAPRAGRVIEVSVASGQTVATGVALLRLE